MTRGRRIEDDVVHVTHQRRIGKEPRERVERGDLRGARAREALGHLRDGGVGEKAPDRPDDALPVLGSRGLGVDVEGGEARHGRDRTDAVRHLGLENLAQVRSGIGRDEEYALARIGEGDRGGRGQARLAHATLPGEEEVARGMFNDVKHGHSGSAGRGGGYVAQQQDVSSPPQQEPPGSATVPGAITGTITGTVPGTIPGMISGMISSIPPAWSGSAIRASSLRDG